MAALPVWVLCRVMWILYSRGRVRVHHLSLSSGHCWNGNWQWLTYFFIVCLCMQMSGRKKATANWHFGSGCQLKTTTHHRSGGGSELKLRWWTQTLSQLEKKHHVIGTSAKIHWRIQKGHAPFTGVISFIFMQFSGKILSRCMKSTPFSLIQKYFCNYCLWELFLFVP